MSDIISRIFQKRGIKNAEELSQEEKETFENWRKILSEGEVTVDKIKEFCEAQIMVIEEKMNNVDNSDQKNSRLVLLHSVYKALMGAIDEPKARREALEKYLTTLT